MSKKKLTEKMLQKYKLIIDKWFTVKFNGAEAYRAFYPNVKKDSTAVVNFSRIKDYQEIKDYIKFKHEEASKVIEVTHEGILQELKNWIESDITETIGLSSEEIKDLPVELRRLIKDYKHNIYKKFDKEGDLISETEVVELSFVSKERALEMINKHIGFYEADNKQKASVVNYEGLSKETLLELWNARTT